MIRNFSSILGAAGFALAVAVCLLATVGDSKAGQFAAESTSLSDRCNAVFPH